MADILVEHGTIITMDPQRRVIEDGSVAIANGRIVAVGPADEVAAAYPRPPSASMRATRPSCPG
jgi:5-methylthioadenosine/S-adenosylhomocysteine deaminase